MTEVPSVPALVDLLHQCLNSTDSAERRQLIRQLQRPIWDFAGGGRSELGVPLGRLAELRTR